MNPQVNQYEVDAARAQIIKWREGGPALFAHEALGVSAEWNSSTREGVLPWQWKASRKLVEKRRLSIRAGKGVGKSAFMSWTLLWFHSCFFPCKAGCTAPTATQLSDVLWAELSLWHERLKERMPDLGNKFEWLTDSFRLIEAPRLSFAVARTARVEKPEALQGLHSQNVLVLIDEASGVEDPIFVAGRGVLASDDSYVLLCSNPTRNSGYFYDTHNTLSERWATMVVNGEDVPLQSQILRDEIISQYGKESTPYLVEVMGEFPSGEDDVVVPLHLATSAVNRDVEVFGPRVWGLDCARFGSDRNVLIERRTNGTDSPHTSWSGIDLMQTSGKVYAKWLETPPPKRPHTIFVDVIGVGAGVADRLQELDLPVVGVNVAESASADDRYQRLRDELWFKARKFLEAKNCKLHNDKTLVSEICLPRYGYVSNGKLKVESKDELRKRFPRSPDVADAFCLTMADASEHRGKQSYEPEIFEDGV